MIWHYKWYGPLRFIKAKYGWLPAKISRQRGMRYPYDPFSKLSLWSLCIFHHIGLSTRYTFCKRNLRLLEVIQRLLWKSVGEMDTFRTRQETWHIHLHEKYTTDAWGVISTWVLELHVILICTCNCTRMTPCMSQTSGLTSLFHVILWFLLFVRGKAGCEFVFMGEICHFMVSSLFNPFLFFL